MCSKGESFKSNSILIKGLSFNIRSTHVDEIFSTFGKVYNVELYYIKGHSTGYAIVEYETFDEASLAVSQMDHGNIDGVEISVEYIVPRITVQECYEKDMKLQES